MPDDASKPAPLAAGRLHEKIYDQLGPFRARLRRKLLRVVEKETPHLARWQTRFRHPVLDLFFLSTAALGSHTAFMLGLPLLWWFGDGSYGRPLLYSLALGVYWSSWLKDALCLPRPFSPPLTRLSIGNHALEYGWPSTHSTLACSTSLSLAFLLMPSIESWLARLAVSILLVFYALSVVLGRLYAGMHSMVDCATGMLLGLLCSIVVNYSLPIFDAFCWNTSPIVPITLVPATLAMVTFYPQPIDNCPCFEDAVSFVGVLLGIALGYHSRSYFGYEPDMAIPFTSFFDLSEIANFLVKASGRIMIGTALVAAWRYVAKKTCQAVLPPIFRAVAPFLELPRRHYKKASEYINYSRKRHDTKAIPKELSDLPAPLDQISEAAEEPQTATLPPTVKQASPLRSKGRARSASEALARALTPSPVHYDVDVLTKLSVYAGIGYLASTGIVYLFPLIHLA